MNLVLTYCWREWRAQRSLLGAFVGFGLAALCLAFTLAPASFWQADGQRAFALSWFVVLGGGSVLAFAAPQLVRSEFGSKGDQFVRRMPGALRASFGGKLLFLLLAALALPLLGLAAGELFLLANGKGWGDLFRWEYTGDVSVRWPWPIVWLGYGALLIPWVWAIGTWLPNGRMAIGGTILFVLLLGLAVVPVLRQCPGLEKSLAYGRWCAVVPLLGVGAAAVSWIRGRHGGGAARSARYGLLATACALVVPGGWLASAAYEYHHPDPQKLGRCDVRALTPDLRFAWVQGSGREEHSSTVPFRVDLRDGSARQLGGCLLGLSALDARPSGRGPMAFSRFFCEVDGSAGEFSLRVLDLASGDWVLRSQGADWASLRRAAEQRVPEVAGRGRSSLLRAPGDVPVWFEGHELRFQVTPDRIERVQWEGDLPHGLRLLGHGFQCFGGSGDHFDLTTRTKVSFSPLHDWRFFVRGSLLGRRTSPKGTWERRLPGSSEFVPVPQLAGSRIVGLLDDDQLLLARWVDKRDELLVWNVTTDLVEVVPSPFPICQGSSHAVSPLCLEGSLLPRDPAGKLWFSPPQPLRRQQNLLMRLDPTTRTWETLPIPTGEILLAWPDANSALVQQHDGIDRVNLTTGARTRLFPRAARDER